MCIRDRATIIELEAQQAWLGNSVELERALDIATEKYNKLIASKDGVTSSTEESEKALVKELETLNARITIDDKFKITLNKLTEEQKVRLKFGDEVTDKQIEYAQAIDAIAEKIDEQNDAEKKLAETQQLRNEITSNLKATISDLAQFEMDSARQVADAKLDLINEQEQRELESLRSRLTFQRATDRRKAEMEKVIIDKHEAREKEVKDKANERLILAFRAEQALKISNVIMNTSEAITKAMAQTGIFGAAWIPIIKAMGATQIGLIAAQNPPKMEYGGLVGGRRHSQGGTIIEAEKGEFVVSRRGVDAIGLEALNRINAGQSQGNIQISFQGNVLSKDFLEDEAIPQIKEALRRGGDIGVG